MTWQLKPKVPDGYSYGGELVFISDSIEVNDNFKYYVESVTFSIKSQYENKYTGFETKKYKVRNSNEKHIEIMMVGNLPRWLQDVLYRLAIAMNGAGMILQFKDEWVTGTVASPVTYECRWINAGDFVDNSELLCGASLDLWVFDSTNTVTITEFQKVINTPASGLEWSLKIGDAEADTIYYRVP